MIFVESGTVPLFTAMKGGMLSVPEPGIPIAGLLLVHSYRVPGIVPVNTTRVVVCPAHTVWLEGVETAGAGFTVI